MRAARPPAGAAAGARGREAGNGRSTPSRARGAGGGGRASPIHTGLEAAALAAAAALRPILLSSYWRACDGHAGALRRGTREKRRPQTRCGASCRQAAVAAWRLDVCLLCPLCRALVFIHFWLRPPGALTFLLTIHDSEKPRPKKHNSFTALTRRHSRQGCAASRTSAHPIWGCGGFRR